MKIWSYWEGDKPEWISKCLESLERHGGSDACTLNWEEFDELWLHDRYLPIRDLYVAQKSDFIRSYLLHHYGGMWIDADCLIMRSLAPIFDSSKLWDFMYYRQKSGGLSNAFIGAKEGSLTAEHFYKGVRWRIQQPQELGWLDIGSRKMEEAINIADTTNLQLANEMVAPYDWNEGHIYAERVCNEKLNSLHNPRVLCHMLSNHGIGGQKEEVAQSLIHEESFFMGLVGKSEHR